MDPIAESFPHLSSFNYASNQPVTSRDLEGLQGENEQKFRTNETQELSEVEIKPESFWQKAGDFLYENVAKNIPVVGGIINSIESFSEGDILGGFLGIGEALLDGVLLVTTGGLGNIAKAGLKSGGKILFKQLAKETGENVVASGVAQAVGDNVPLGLQIAAGLMGVRPKNWKKGNKINGKKTNRSHEADGLEQSNAPERITEQPLSNGKPESTVKEIIEKPVNSHLASGKHPISGVPFDEKGFPNFEEFKYKNGKNDVLIEGTGNRKLDEKAANEAAGYERTPKGYTWHHHQDSGRMQLVEQKAHRQTGHTGGFSIWSTKK